MRVARSARAFLIAVCGFFLLRSCANLFLVFREHRPEARYLARKNTGDLRDYGLKINREELSNSSGQLQKTNDSYHRDLTCAHLLKPQPHQLRFVNDAWQVHRTRTAEIMVYAAHYDDRPAVGLLPHIRVLAVGRLPKSDLYCHVWYADKSQPYLTKVLVNTTGRGDVINKKKYHQVLMSCSLPSSFPVPSHVSIATTACSPSSILLPVLHHVRTTWEHEFGICVAIAFGKEKLSKFVEWMGFHHLMGVSEVNLYDGNITLDAEMNKVIEHYTEKGWLRVFRMPPPVEQISYTSIKLSSPASLNDCMLRNMYRYRYAAILDFDEFIVPKDFNKVKNYHDLLNVIDKHHKLKEPWMSYTFRNTYFLLNFDQDSEQPSNLRTMRYRDRALPSRPFYAAKSFIDPRRCFSVFNHYCYIRFPDSDKKFSIDIDPKIAASHHYRKCNKDCEKLTKERTKDDTMLQFKDYLSAQVTRVLSKLDVS